MAAGRYEEWPVVDPAWLDQNIFVHRPEVIGAAWDNRTGEAVALMTFEGKMQSETRAGKLHLKLLVPRETLSDYERQFVDRLFIRGDEIDPDTLRKHYETTGFDPAATLYRPLADASRALAGSSVPMAVNLVGCVGLIFVTQAIAFTGALFNESLAILGFMSAVALGASFVLASWYRSQLKGEKVAGIVGVPIVIYALLACILAPAAVALITFLAYSLFMLVAVLAVARWRRGSAELQNLRMFRAAREFFLRHLVQKNETVEDRWVPYLLAFGLAPQLDHWSVSRPQPPATTTDFDDSRPSRPSHGSAAHAAAGFAGGGGKFGGAGASAGWATAVTSLAAQVPAPSAGGGGSGSSWSSSSSSSSRSSGGSRSGGGGGGW